MKTLDTKNLIQSHVGTVLEQSASHLTQGRFGCFAEFHGKYWRP